MVQVTVNSGFGNAHLFSTFTHVPSSDDLNQTLSQLATAYATQRVAVTFIFAKRVDKVRLFKKTFRMIKGEE